MNTYQAPSTNCVSSTEPAAPGEFVPGRGRHDEVGVVPISSSVVSEAGSHVTEVTAGRAEAPGTHPSGVQAPLACVVSLGRCVTPCLCLQCSCWQIRGGTEVNGEALPSLL